jgi:transcription elongation factor GreA
MSDRVPMTKQGYETLKTELRKLRAVDRPENVKDIEEARAHGDISENAEFAAAKERQAHIAGRIVTLDDKLARAQIIDPSGEDGDPVRFGATVELEDSENGEAVCYTIVGEDEADISKGLISVTSPVARALMNKAPEDEVTVKVPKGTRQFEILAVRYK